jgi:hypothetical protein
MGVLQDAARARELLSDARGRNDSDAACATQKINLSLTVPIDEEFLVPRCLHWTKERVPSQERFHVHQVSKQAGLKIQISYQGGGSKTTAKAWAGLKKASSWRPIVVP